MTASPMGMLHFARAATLTSRSFPRSSLLRPRCQLPTKHLQPPTGKKKGPEKKRKGRERSQPCSGSFHNPLPVNMCKDSEVMRMRLGLAVNPPQWRAKIYKYRGITGLYTNKPTSAGGGPITEYLLNTSMVIRPRANHNLSRRAFGSLS